MAKGGNPEMQLPAEMSTFTESARALYTSFTPLYTPPRGSAGGSEQNASGEHNPETSIRRKDLHHDVLDTG